MKVSRRTVLRGVGGVSIALPWLEAMGVAATPAIGAPGVGSNGFPKRLIVLYSPNGTIPDAFFPTGGETDFALSPILQPLARHRNDIIVMKGIDYTAAYKTSIPNGHFSGIGCMLTGQKSVGATEQTLLADGISIDQYLGDRIAANPQSRPPFRSLTAGIRAGRYALYGMSYAGPSSPVPVIGNAKNLFNYLFASGSAISGDSARIQAMRKSILDGALRDALALQRKLPVADGQRLDRHMNAIREVEQRLGRSATCNASGVTPGTTTDFITKLPEMISQAFDVLSLAVACDLSRVATYMMRTEGATGGQYTYGWLGVGPLGQDSRPDDAVNKEHHAMSHHDKTVENRADLIKVNAWYMEQVASLIDRLKSIREGNGTAFDNSVILYGSGISEGNHSWRNIPCLVAGSAGKYFRTGRYLQYQHAPNNDLLVSLLNAMGVDSNTFGDPTVCRGPLPNLV